MDILKLIVPALIAIISLCFNFYQWRQLGKEKAKAKTESARAEKNRSIRDAIVNVLSARITTNIFDLEVRLEFWGQGFPSLEKIRESISTSVVILMTADNESVSPELKGRIKTLSDQLASLIKMRDSYNTFLGNLKAAHRRLPTCADDEDDWNDKQNAMNALGRLQTELNGLEVTLLETLHSL